jgi:hypothetical protein
MWLLAGYLCLVLSAVLAWIMVQVGSPQSAIVVGLLGAAIDVALIGRGVWIYIRVMRMRAHDRIGKPRSIVNSEWILAVAFLVIPLSIYTFWFFRFR